MAEQVVVRFAPSPTGPLHIGGVRTALFNYLFARKHGGRMILRIEDTDRTRYVEGAEPYIIESLAWLGIEFDEDVNQGGPVGPYRQSDRARQGLYRKYANQLLDSGHAYRAFDTPAELDAMRERLKEAGSSAQQYNALTRHDMTNSLSLSAEEVEAKIKAGEPYVVRMKMPADETIQFQDVVREEVSFHSSQLDDKILLKSDGMPTYHLANVVDDHLMEITHIIRGEEWLSSTPLHILLYRAFGWTPPVYVHLPLILNPNGKGKMSKRQGDKLGFSVFPTNWTDPETQNLSTGYREDGYLAEALLNFLALLGWNPGDEEEIMDKARLIERFELERIISKGATFDLDKLKWFNETYIRAKTPEDLLKLVLPYWKQAGYALPDDETYLLQVVEVLQERATLLPDFVPLASYFFAAPTTYDEKFARKRWKAESPEIMLALKEKFSQVEQWNAANLHACFESLVAEREIGAGKVLAPLRLVLTGQSSGPGAFDIAAILGEAESLSRIDLAIERLTVA